MLLFCANVWGQNISQCGFDSLSSNIKITDSNYKSRLRSIYNFVTSRNLNNKYPLPSNIIADSTKYNIPVLVHLINELPTDPIMPYSQVVAQINALNSAFAGMKIQFYLVKTNVMAAPATMYNASTEPGIIRYPTNTSTYTQLANLPNSIASLNLINTNTFHANYAEVLNIWVVKTIGGCNGIKGYATFPNAYQNFDGIVITSDVFGGVANNAVLAPNGPFCSGGSNGIAYNQGKQLVHEIGHYFSLYHTFENGGCNGASNNCNKASADGGGDEICDTDPTLPPTSTFTCSATNPSTCGYNTDATNYMYLSADPCRTHFTNLQINRMKIALLGYRFGLFTNKNLNKYGIIGTTAMPAQPFADFTATTTMPFFYTNTPVSLTQDISSPSNTATTFNYTYSTSPTTISGTATNPIVTWNTAGCYTVTCTATNGAYSFIFINKLNLSNINKNAALVQNSQWYFGRHVGVGFQTSIPVVNKDANIHSPKTVFSFESTTSNCDNNGNIIYFTDGTDVWDVNQTQINTIHPMFPSSVYLMDNGINYVTNSAYDGVISCPVPNSTNKYYIFKSPQAQDLSITHDVNYVILDLTLNTVTPYTAVKLNNSSPICTESATIIPHCNGVDYWLINTDINGNMYSTLITRYGIAENVSNKITIPNLYGESSIKANQDNTKIAVTNTVDDLSIIDFNNSDGSFNSTINNYFNNYISFSSSLGRTMGLTFNSTSKTGLNKIYVGFRNQSIYSFDLTTNTWDNSPIPTSFGNMFNTPLKMQVAPDDNIYFIAPSGNVLSNITLSTIQSPNTTTPTINNNNLFLNIDKGMDDLNLRSLPQFIDGIKPDYNAPTLSYKWLIGCNALSLSIPSCWGGYYYHIDWGDGGSDDINTILPNPNHTYSNPGNYSIVVTFCQPSISAPIPYTAPAPAITSTINIIILPLPTVTLNTSSCNPSSITVTTTNATTQSWINPVPTSFGPVSAGTTIPTNFAQGNYVVTVTNASTGCTATATINTTPPPYKSPCVYTPMPLPPTITPTTVIPPSSTGYIINATTTIVNNVTLSGMDIVIAPNVNIILNNSATLNISNCYLHTCSSMWNGILLSNGSTLNINNNSLIEDAIVAVTTVTSSYINLNTATFNKNREDVVLTGYNANNFVINNCVFTCRDLPITGCTTGGWPTVASLMLATPVANSLESPYKLLNAPLPIALKNPLIPRTVNHIRVNNFGVTTGTLVSHTFIELKFTTLDNTFNLIDNANNGINVLNSNVWVSNCVIQKCNMGINALTDPVQIIPYNNGIPYYRLKVVPFAGYLAPTPNKFFDNGYADINAKDYTWHLIQNNDLRSTQSLNNVINTTFPAINNNTIGQNGIIINSGFTAATDVTYNKIYNHYNGIITFGKNNLRYTNCGGSIAIKYFSGLSNIAYNTIANNITGNNPTPTIYPFISNAITSNLYFNYLTNCNGTEYLPIPNPAFSIDYNTITNAYRGIYANGFTFSRQALNIRNNSITLNADPNTSTTGTQFGMWLSYNMNVHCLSNTVNGLAPDVSKTITQINAGPVAGRESNFLIDNGYNQRITCNTSNQGVFGFQFNGPSGILNTQWVQLNDMKNPHYYGYFLNNGAAIGQQPSAGSIYPNCNNTFNFTPTGNAYQTYCYGTATNPTLSINSILKVKSGGNTQPTFNWASNFLWRYTGPSLLTNIIAPLTGCSPAPSLMRLGFSTSSADISPVLNAPSSVDINYVAKQLIYNTQCADSLYITALPELQAFYNASNAPTSQLRKMRDIEDNIAIANYTTAQTLNTAFVPANAIETNQKNYYNLLIKFASGTALTEADKSALLSIANLCPHTSGACVYAARILYNQISIENNVSIYTFYDDCSNNGGLYKKAPIVNLEKPFEAIIYPNPTTNGFYINTNLLVDEEISVEIHDITGKLVVNIKLQTYSNSCYCPILLAQGVYIVTIKNNKNEQVIKKVSIQ